MTFEDVMDFDDIDSMLIKFAEWIVVQDIVQLNSGGWIKNNPSFGQFAVSSKELLRKFKEDTF